jgi:D-glycero-alpha-D-manno-heptose 1-phosphate guanylyltransferase
VKGRPFLSHVLDYWKAQGIQRFVLATGYKHEAFEEYFGREYRGVPVEYSVETEPLGTGGGLFAALPRLNGGDGILVLNGDTFFEVPLAPFLDGYRRRQADLALAVSKRTEGGRYETVSMDRDGRVTAFRPREEGQREACVNGGVYLMNLEFLRRRDDGKRLRASLESDFFPRWLREGAALFAYPCGGRFIDIGTPESYRAAAEVFQTEEEKRE